MSRHETWRTRKYWESNGGLLIEEFLAVRRADGQGKRCLDGLIVLGEEKGIHKGTSFDIKGKDVIVIQTKKNRLGMYLLGQAYFSKFLIEKFEPKSIRAVAICGKGDTVLEKIAEMHGVEVVVMSDEEEKIFN